MCHSYHVDVPQLGSPKNEINFLFPNEELDVDSVVDDHDSKMSDISQYINDELDLEVAIRERLASTIEGRIQWALRMLDAFSTVKEPQDQPFDADDFQEAALDALEALETPSAFLFDTGFPEAPSPPSSYSPIVPNHPASQRAPKTRSSRTPKPSQQKKSLYIKFASGTSDSQLAILSCPICGRTQFTTLQGLLNHARLAHGVEWASHDACITACAVPVSADPQSRESCERDGVEVPWGEGVVGLRRLFERAVGVDDISPSLLLAHTDSDISLEHSPSTLLSRSLGLHADSPALAQFLGRAPKRRCIHVYDEDQDADIVNTDDTTLRSGALLEEPPKKGFCMHYPHRNTARKDLDLVVDVDTGVETIRANNTSTPAVIPAGTTTSRFHITARIRLEDRSLFLKEDRRTQFGTADQYRWMLIAKAPSYSLPLSSFLTCVTVVPPRTVSPVLLTVQQQPFSITGTANEPFMAKVIFEWIGGGKMEVEHWVELDQSKSSTSVFGSEQLFDVELDRNLSLLPVPKGSPPPLPSLDRQLPFDSPPLGTPQTEGGYSDSSATKDEYYEQVLRNLLPKVPMTAKDMKSRVTVQVSYKLVASPAHLLGLVPGRRKAIEWARARALYALYVEHMTSIPSCQQMSLTVGDVYMFLEDTSQFPRPLRPAPGPVLEPKRKKREKDGTPVLGEEFCPTCGIKRRLHAGYDIKGEEDAVRWTCTVVPTAEQQYGQRFPLANLARVLAWPNGLEEAVREPLLLPTGLMPKQSLKHVFPPWQYTPCDLVAVSPPELVLAVQKAVSKLRLPTFPDITPQGDNPVFLPSRGEAERSLAPAALLSITLKPFISTLLRSAMEIAKQDATLVAPAGKDGRRTKKLTFVLTPGHVLRGLRLQSANNLRAVSNLARTSTRTSFDPRARESTALCLAQLGVPLDFRKESMVADSVKLGGNAAVKAEPE